MSIPVVFADIAQAFSAAGLGAFYDGVARWSGEPAYDDGGSIATPGTPVAKSCQVQIDAATEAMRQAEGFADGDMRMLVLAATLDGDLDTSATVEVLAGPHVGAWMVSAVNRDPCGVYWEARGRRAA